MFSGRNNFDSPFFTHSKQTRPLFANTLMTREMLTHTIRLIGIFPSGIVDRYPHDLRGVRLRRRISGSSELRASLLILP